MIKGPKDYLKLGDHNSFCMRCGFKYKASELKKEWTGYLVCGSCWEPRHPQDLIRGIRETPPPKDQSPRNDGFSSLIPTSWGTGVTVPIYLMNPDGDFILTPDGDKIIIGYNPPLTVVGMPDNAGPLYFVEFGPVDRSKL